MNTEIVLPPGIAWLYPWQNLVVRKILEPGGSNLIVLLPTGSGKSLCFQVPAGQLPGLTVLVFPLLALMNDQGRRLTELGLPWVSLRGGQTRAQRKEVWSKLKTGDCKLVVTNPETLLQPAVLTQLKALRVSHLVIDEAHFVTEWGRSFRPAYLELGNLARQLNPEKLTAFTATASPRILNDLRELVFDRQPAELLQASPDRPNLFFRVRPGLAPVWDCLQILRRSPGLTLVFRSSRQGVQATALRLQMELGNRPVRFYHAGLGKSQKVELEQWFRSQTNAVLVTTSAFGTGVDVSGIRTVIHLDLPASPEAYLQEAGRAGRDGQPAEVWALLDSQRIGGKAGIHKAFGQRHGQDGCRRRQLLAELDSTVEDCAGCDWCTGQTAEYELETDWLAEILKPAARTLPWSALPLWLAGIKNPRFLEAGWTRLKGFGALRGTSLTTLRELVQALTDRGWIKRLSWGLWKGCFALSFPDRLPWTTGF